MIQEDMNVCMYHDVMKTYLVQENSKIKTGEGSSIIKPQLTCK